MDAITPREMLRRYEALRQIDQQDKHYALGQWAKANFFADEKAAKWCASNITKAHGEGTNSSGGFLVPNELERLIFSARSLAGVFRQNATTRLIGSDNRTQPRRTGGLTVSWTAEAAALSESTANFDAITLQPKKATVFCRASSEVLEDETAAFGAWLADEIGDAFASEEDRIGFKGTGIQTDGSVTGLTTKLNDGNHTASVATAASNNDTFAELTAADLASASSLLPEQFARGAKWYCSHYALQQTFVRLGATVYGQVDTPDGPLPLMQYGGSPIVTTPHMPGSGDQSGAVMLLYGSMRASSILAYRRQVRIQASEHVYLDRDQIAFKGTERVTINNHLLGSNSEAGSMIALVGN